MTDFRALCAELVSAWDDLPWEYDFKGNVTGIHGDLYDDSAVDRARAALAEPKPERPTDEDLLDLHDWMTDEWAANHDFELPPIQYARAVLTRWGNPAPQVNPWKETLIDALVCNFLLNTENKDNPKKALNDLIAWEKQLATDPLINFTPQPVPVSERLPGPEDCDEKGRCWWWHPSHPESGYLEGWMLRPRFWGVGHYDFDDRLTHTHWLPAHALPLPTAND